MLFHQLVFSILFSGLLSAGNLLVWNKDQLQLQSYLPSLGALLGELGKVDRLLRILLPVLLSTRLDEEGVG